MTKKPLKKFWAFLMWLLALLIALAVGFGMTSGTLLIKWLPAIVTVVAGWFVIVLTLIGLVMAIFEKLK
jgi:hypothetical protein